MSAGVLSTTPVGSPIPSGDTRVTVAVLEMAERRSPVGSLHIVRLRTETREHGVLSVRLGISSVDRLIENIIAARAAAWPASAAPPRTPGMTAVTSEPAGDSSASEGDLDAARMLREMEPPRGPLTGARGRPHERGKCVAPHPAWLVALRAAVERVEAQRADRARRAAR